MTRPKNPASIVSKYRSRWNWGASVDATVTQEKSTRLNGHLKPNHQTFFLQIPTRSGSTSGRASSVMTPRSPPTYLAGSHLPSSRSSSARGNSRKSRSRLYHPVIPERDYRNQPEQEPDVYSQQEPVPWRSNRQQYYHTKNAQPISNPPESYHNLAINQMLLFLCNNVGENRHDY